MKEMFGGVNLKMVIFVVVGVLVLVLGVLGLDTAKTYLSGAAGGVEPIGVSVNAMETSAVITWTSEVANLGGIEYGTSPASLLLRAPETEPTTNHRVTLSPLREDISYYFRIRVGDEVFDNNGILYSFKTKAGSDQVASVTTTPVISPVPTNPSRSGGTNCITGVDYNNDGVINAYDMAYCSRNRGGGAGVSPTPVGGCRAGVDYDGNGVINSFDQVWCLQNGGN